MNNELDMTQEDFSEVVSYFESILSESDKAEMYEMISEDLDGANKFVCFFCKLTLKIASKFLKKTSTIDDMIRFFSHMCKIFPSNFRPYCQNFMSKGGKMLIEVIANQRTLDGACQLTKMC